MNAAVQLRSETRWVSTAEGCVIGADTGLAVIRGEGVAAWLDRLAPVLDGRFGLAEVTGSLPADQAAPVRSLIRGLIERGFVRLVQEMPPIGEMTVQGTGPIADAVRVALRSAEIGLVDESDRVVRIVESSDVLHATPPAEVELLAVGDQVWVGGAGCGVELADAWLRAGDQRQPPTDTDGPAATVIQMAAAQVAHRLTADVPTRALPDGRMTVWRDATSVSQHRVVPHPRRAPKHVDLAGGVERLRLAADTPALDPDRFSLLAARCADEMFGLIGGPDEGDYRQVPLPVSVTSVADPYGLAGGPTRVHGTGWDFTEARYECALRGLARYAERCVDRRLLSEIDGVVSVPAIRLVADGDHLGDAVAEPAARCYPLLVGRSSDRGLASGLSWGQALTRAAAGLLREQAIAAIWRGTVGLQEVDPGDSDDDRIRYAIGMAVAAGSMPAICLVTGVWPGEADPPAVAVAVDRGRPIALRVAADRTTAIRDVLQDFLLRQQAAADPAADYAVPTMGPSTTVGRMITDSDSAAIAENSVDLVAVLARTGDHSVSLLDHDQALTAKIPFLIRVMADD